MNEDNLQFAKWMEASFLDDADVAAKLGSSEQYIYALRKGYKAITDGFRWRFARAYGYDFAVKLLDKEPTP